MRNTSLFTLFFSLFIASPCFSNPSIETSISTLESHWRALQTGYSSLRAERAAQAVREARKNPKIQALNNAMFHATNVVLSGTHAVDSQAYRRALNTIMRHHAHFDKIIKLNYNIITNLKGHNARALPADKAEKANKKLPVLRNYSQAQLQLIEIAKRNKSRPGRFPKVVNAQITKLRSAHAKFTSAGKRGTLKHGGPTLQTVIQPIGNITRQSGI